MHDAYKDHGYKGRTLLRDKIRGNKSSCVLNSDTCKTIIRDKILGPKVSHMSAPPVTMLSMP